MGGLSFRNFDKGTSHTAPSLGKGGGGGTGYTSGAIPDVGATGALVAVAYLSNSVAKVAKLP